MSKHIRVSMFAFAAAAALACGLAAACAKGGEERPRTVAMIVAGAFGDDSFFDGALKGLQRAAKEFDLKYETIECDESLGRYEIDLTGAAGRADIVVVLGYQFYDVVQSVALSAPDTRFIYLDGRIEGIPNLSSVDFIEAEGAYLAGTLAALVTTSADMPKANPEKRVGIVGGMDIPVIHEFIDGYLAGVESVDPEIEAYVAFAGTFVDPEATKKAAGAMYAAGADVVFQAAGGAGQGVFAAAGEFDRYAIGVDMDQRYLDPGRILASMVKNAGTAVYDFIKRAVSGEITSGAYRQGLAGGAISLEYGEGDPLVPPAMIDRVKLVETQLIFGSRQIPGAE